MRRNIAAPPSVACELPGQQRSPADRRHRDSLQTSRARAAGAIAYAAVRAAWLDGGLEFSAPGPADHIILVRGMPVAPWMRLRPMEDVWATWLAGLRLRWHTWAEGAEVGEAPPDSGEVSVDQRWDAWRTTHVHSLEFRRALPGSERLAQLLANPRLADVDAHLIGHSVGGAAVLSYLTGARAGRLPAPRARVRAAITLDAALTGVAGMWSGARTFARHGAEERLDALGTWARQRGVNLLTIANERDIWSHRALADVPYVGLSLGPPLDLGAQLNGAVHGWLRRMPEVIEALWPVASSAWVGDQIRA